MKKILAFFFLSYVIFSLHAEGDIPKNYVRQNHRLSIGVDTPPVLMFVEDDQGRKTGANPALPMSDEGEQVGTLGLQEIPLSNVEQQNVASDEDPQGKPQASTGWLVNILDGGLQTYTIHLKGIELGISIVDISGGFKKGIVPRLIRSKLEVLIEPSSTREIKITFDPTARAISAHRMVNSQDLGKDIEISCRLDLINPKGICQELKAKAESVEKAFGKKDTKLAIQHLEVFLKDLEVKKSKIKEPAFTILREETQTLLDDLKTAPPQASTEGPNSEPTPGGFFQSFLSRLAKLFG